MLTDGNGTTTSKLRLMSLSL